MKNILFTLVFFLITSNFAAAVDIAPRITDKEIIESLAQIKADIKIVNNDIDSQNALMNAKFDGINKFLTFIVALILIFIGFIIWDRHSFIKPLHNKIDEIDLILINELDLRNVDGSVLKRLIAALHKLAKNDKKLTEVLKSFSLL